MRKYIAQVVLTRGNGASYRVLGQAMATMGFSTSISDGQEYALPRGTYYCEGALTLRQVTANARKAIRHSSFRIGAARQKRSHYDASLVVVAVRDMGWSGLSGAPSA